LEAHLLPRGEKNPAIIIFPGGGYGHHAVHEAVPVAKWLNSIGISAFILYYRIAPHYYPAPLEDARNAFIQVRQQSKKYGIDPARIGVLGFSAGGHLAGLLITETKAVKEGGTEVPCSKPDFAILCYPVISFSEYQHE